MLNASYSPGAQEGKSGSEEDLKDDGYEDIRPSIHSALRACHCDNSEDRCSAISRRGWDCYCAMIFESGESEERRLCGAGGEFLPFTFMMQSRSCKVILVKCANPKLCDYQLETED